MRLGVGAVSKKVSALDISAHPGANKVANLWKGKHIGRLPVFIALFFVVMMAGAILYGAISRVDSGSTVAVDEGGINPNLSNRPGRADSANSFVVEAPSFTPPPKVITPPKEEDEQGLFGLFPTGSEFDKSVREIEHGERIERIRSVLLGVKSVPTVSFTGFSGLVSASLNDEVSEGGGELSRGEQRELERGGRDELLKGYLDQMALAQGGADARTPLLDNATGQGSKERFLNDGATPEPGPGYLPSAVHQPASPYILNSGTLISGILLTEINTDLPGDIVGQVSQNIYDSPTGDYLLIPQGARIIGVYDARVAYGQRRALIRWDRLIFPNGATLNIEGMKGVDHAGAGGYEDKLNNHYWRTFGQIFLLSVVQAAPAELLDKDKVTAGNSETDKIIASNFSQTGLELINRNLAIQPTIRIRQGYRFNIFVNQDILFPGEYR